MKQNEYLEKFMARFPFEGLTYDDVSLVLQYADFLPDSTDLSTRLTSRIRINIPFLSAAMDTVTEAPMAVAMAMQGGIGVIHKNLTVEQQADQVSQVKHHLNGLIHSPIAFHAGQTLDEILAEREQKRYKFSGFPILDDAGRVVGVLTSKDIDYAEDTSVKVEEVMTRDPITAPKGTSLQEAYKIMRGAKKGKLPLVDRDGKLVGLYSFTDVRDLVEQNLPMVNRDAQYRLRVLPDVDIIAGNIVTGEAAVALRDAGAHAVKVGIGPGSICTTRVVCGVGVPQITAVYEVAKALQGTIPCIADGGIRYSGDVPKAIVAGAETVMLGSILAGTEESPGEKIIQDGRQYVVYRGMGSMAAMQAFEGSRKRYGQSHRKMKDLVPEGIEGIIPYAGTVQKVMTQFCGGLRSSLGYNGARSVEELHDTGRFVRVSAAGVKEAHPHDIRITREAPNYTRS